MVGLVLCVRADLVSALKWSAQCVCSATINLRAWLLLDVENNLIDVAPCPRISGLIGFDRPALASGETITVVGYLRMEHAGVREFRVGLVVGGFRFIDDNAFRKAITVTE